MNTTFDPFLHTPAEAVRALIESQALEATLTWDGKDNYRVGPSAQYAPLDPGHVAIWTKEAMAYCGWDAENLEGAEEFLSDNQTDWMARAMEEQQ